MAGTQFCHQTVYDRLAARLKDLMSLRGLPSAFEIYTCVVLHLFFILCVLVR